MARHLGDELSDYVDRRMPAALLLAWDRHLVGCQLCRCAADQERRVLASLRANPAPHVPSGLHQMLLALSLPGEPPAGAAGVAPAGPPIPAPPPGAPHPLAVGPSRLPTLGRAAPAHYRSLRRPLALAGAVAGSAAAAALTIGLATPVGSSSAAVVQPAPATAPGWNAVGVSGAYSWVPSVVQVGGPSRVQSVLAPATERPSR